MLREDTRRILPLPSDVVTQIKSSTVITSLSDVVLGLLENSLDAQAQKISIQVDFSKGYCVVEDDGLGIEASDFGVEGGLTKPFHTTKYDLSVRTYGSKGLFLAAVAALALLTVTSRRSSHETLSSLVQHRSDILTRLVPAPPQHEIFGREHGTRVTVQDLFGNMPVRVKQRIVSTTQTNGDKEMESLKRQIIALLVCSNRRINVHMTDNSSNKRTLTIQAKRGASEALNPSKNEEGLLRPPEPAWLSGVLLQSGLVDQLKSEEWVKVSARTAAVQATGLISTRPMPSKQVSDLPSETAFPPFAGGPVQRHRGLPLPCLQLQFLALGLKPLQANSRSNPLFEDINKTFSLSRFGSIENYDESKNPTKPTDRRYKQDGLTIKDLRGAGKRLDRWPMFFIRINLTDKIAAIETLDNVGVMTSISKVLHAMAVGFLRDNNFRPRATTLKRQTTPKGHQSLSRHASDKIDIFSSWSRIKSSRSFACKVDEKDESYRSPTVAVEDLQPSLDAPESVKETHCRHENLLASFEGPKKFMECIDPVTRRKILIDRRTGMPAAKMSVPERPKTALSTSRAGAIFFKDAAGFRPSAGEDHEGPASWADDVLKTWNNPIFAPAESAIPYVSNETNGEIAGSAPQGSNVRSIGHSLPSMSASSTISRSMLAGAQLIRQVDSKFLLVRVSTHDVSSLVLIDQHAADERVRVEALLNDLNTRPAIELSKPIDVDLAARERDLLLQKSERLTTFGIRFTTSSQGESIPQFTETPFCQSKVQVTYLPPVIAERCRLQPSLVLDLVRSVIWSDEPFLPTNASPSTLPIPPKALMDLINSRACRSAIMFNDVLSREEGEALLQKLSATKLPFQCAHGRTSMVPLVEFGLGDQATSDEDEDCETARENFAEKWKRWRAQKLGVG